MQMKIVELLKNMNIENFPRCVHVDWVLVLKVAFNKRSLLMC
jgi:hypothetical protein